MSDLTCGCDWDTYLRGEPRAGLHWHGFLWSGEGWKRASFKLQAERTLGTEQFAASDVPPDMTGWNLAKRRLVHGTWTDVGDAATWMLEQYRARPSAAAPTHGPECHVAFARRMLSLGKDDIWTWPLGGGSEAHVAVICCPNELWKDIPCPQPPR